MSDLNKLQGYALRLIVEAVDQGSKPLKTQAIVNIKVIQFGVEVVDKCFLCTYLCRSLSNKSWKEELSLTS